MSEWMPIETAPKDGTFILLYGPTLGVVTGFRETEADGSFVSQWDAGASRGVAYEEGITPTHWMPLPAPPKE